MPTGNRVLDFLFLLFLTVYYDGVIPEKYGKFVLNKPILLVPFKVSEGCYSIFDKINNELLPLHYKCIEFVDHTLQQSTSCIISDKRSFLDYSLQGYKYKDAAIISNPKDLLDIHWYKQLLPIGTIRTLFIAENNAGSYGIVDDNNRIILDFFYQDISAIIVGDDFYLKCKKSGYYGLLNKDLKVVIPFIQNDIKEYYFDKFIVCKHNILYNRNNDYKFAVDLTSLKECKLPTDYNKIISLKEGIFIFEVSEGNYRFYSFKRQCYINDYTYQRVSQYEEINIKSSYILCKRGGISMLLSIDGIEYPIQFNGTMNHYGETVIGVTPVEIKEKDCFGNFITRYNYDVCVYKKSNFFSRFTYKVPPSFMGVEAFEVINEGTIKTLSGGHLNLKGERVLYTCTSQNTNGNNLQDQNRWLINLVKDKYLNSKYIADFEKLESCCDLLYVIGVGDIAEVRIFWDYGDGDMACGGDIRIGYADENNCYWSRESTCYID